MGYDEPKFIAGDVILEPAAPLPLIGQVMTASGALVTSTYTAVNDIRTAAAAVVVGGFVICDTVGQGGAVYTVQIQSGTKVLSTALLANTAGSSANFSLDTSSTSVPAGGAFNVSVIGTGTASATQNSPALRVGVQVRYQFA
jgi:hypothetical protein